MKRTAVLSVKSFLLVFLFTNSVFAQTYRSWQCIPSVIRDNGVEEFFLIVDPGTEVDRIELTDQWLSNSVYDGRSWPCLQYPESLTFRDDGTNGDQIAGDNKFTLGPFKYNAGSLPQKHYNDSVSNPIGIEYNWIGKIKIVATDQTEHTFLLQPKIGILSSQVPEIAINQINSEAQTTTHLLNILEPDYDLQKYQRHLGDLVALSNSVYTHMPDIADFLVFMSTNKLETNNRLDRANFRGGGFCQVAVEHTGTAILPFDDRARFGSQARLLGIITLDTNDRGQVSNNLLHELLSQYIGYFHPDLEISDPNHTDDISWRTDIGSLVGGFKWDDIEGTYYMNWDVGRNGAFEASLFDLYYMGLSPSIPLIHLLPASGPMPLFRKDQAITDIVRTITINDIIGYHGERLPKVNSLNLRLVFVVTSQGRLLNSTEMTFYHLLAKHATQEIPDKPFASFNWVPISNFFGEKVMLSSNITSQHVFDYNGDNDIDENDLKYFKHCYSGPAVPLKTGCESLDLNNDCSIDQTDFGYFQRCLSGPDVLLNPSCQEPTP